MGRGRNDDKPACDCSKLTWQQKLKLAIGLIMPIVSMILAISGYASFSASADEFAATVDNWKIAPIVDAQWVASLPCPAGWSNAGTQLNYGYYTNDCDCTSRNASKSGCNVYPATKITGRVCTSTGSASETACGCDDVQTSRSLSITKWTGDHPYLCVLRDAAITALRRKRTSKAGDCSMYTGTRACGNWDCVPTTSQCPIVVFGDANPSNVDIGQNWQFEAAQNSSSQTLAFNRTGYSNDPMAYLPQLEIRIGTEYPLSGASVRPWFSTGAISGQPDSRWSTFHTQSVTDILNANSASYIPLMLSQGRTASDWTGKSWVMMSKQELKWKTTCPSTRQDIVNLGPAVKSVLAAQTVCMIFAIIVALFNFYSGWTDLHEMTDDDPDNDGNAGKKKAVCNMLAESANLVPSIIAMVYASGIYQQFVNVDKASCSDSLTNMPIHDLAASLKSLGTTAIVKTVFATLFLIYRIVSYLRLKYCPPAPKGMAQKDQHAGGAEMASKDIATPPEYTGT